MPDYNDDSSSDDDDEDDGKKNEKKKRKVVKIEIDLSVSAYGNAQRYYTMKRQAANKEQRTHDASHNVSSLPPTNHAACYITPRKYFSFSRCFVFFL